MTADIKRIAGDLDKLRIELRRLWKLHRNAVSMVEFRTESLAVLNEVSPLIAQLPQVARVVLLCHCVQQTISDWTPDRIDDILYKLFDLRPWCEGWLDCAASQTNVTPSEEVRHVRG